MIVVDSEATHSDEYYDGQSETVDLGTVVDDRYSSECLK